MAKNRGLFFLLLSVVACLGQIALCAQEIDLPDVIWKDPNGKEFHVRDKVVLHFQSTVDDNKLRARVFRGSKQELIADRRNAQGKYCVIYASTVHTLSGRSPDGVGVDWYPDMGSLERRSDGGNDDQVYTIVLEKNTNDEIKAFRLDPNDVAKYFDRGLQINVKADGYQTAGSWPVQVVQKVEVGAMKVADVLKAIIPGSEATISLAANKPTNAGTTDCIRIHTLVASDSPNSDSGQLTAQLEPEPCLMVGQPTTFHMPTGLMRTGWILR